MIFWGLVDSPLLGVVFLLVLAALSIIRYRVLPYRWLGTAEAAVCLAYSFFWLPALLGLWLPVIGFLEGKWHEREEELLRKDYEDRSERIKLENDRISSAREIQNAARLAEITERARIAQDIHDHVGHELSGASIALQTAVKLYRKNDPRTGELLVQSSQRLEAASEHLREAVHNLKPSQLNGIETLAELCDGFSFCGAELTVTGDTREVEHWNLLEANLKEALTNVQRHSDATRVSVHLDTNAHYVRLIVRDNGQARAGFKPGLGLSGMRERVRAAGGTLTVNTENGFEVIAVLPKGGNA